MPTQPVNLHTIAYSAMARYGFEPRFPAGAIREAEALREENVLTAASGDVKDLRGLLWSSIDNNDSLDLDQLEYCQQAPDGSLAVKIAIADVDAFVPAHSAIDEHARRNATSVYTGIETFTMLPQRLSTELTSLLNGKDRLAVVVEYRVLADGSIRPGGVYRSLVNNKAKLVYEQVGDWLEGKGPMPQTVRAVAGLEAQLRLQDEAAGRLQSFRLRQGALELETIEARPVISGDTVTGLVVPRENKARYIIENFMIASNEVIVGFLNRAGLPMIQRIVRTPKDWPSIMQTAAVLGGSLPAEPEPKALSAFLAAQRSKDPERFPDLSLTIVKLLGPGEYTALAADTRSSGHFGLAVMDYTHSTAPNRRYVDILIQRMVKSALEKASAPYTLADLAELAASCTERDKAAKKVERFMRKASAAVLLAGRINEEFEAIVTGASEKGFYCRIIAPPAEGRVIRNEAGLSVGRKIRVRLISVDAANGFIDFERIK